MTHHASHALADARRRSAKDGTPTDQAEDHSEGIVARTLEEHTAKLPSDIWLWAALGSMGLALALHARDRKHESLLVGQWAAPFLLVGLYNKLVKIGGSDRVRR